MREYIRIDIDNFFMLNLSLNNNNNAVKSIIYSNNYQCQDGCVYNRVDSLSIRYWCFRSPIAQSKSLEYGYDYQHQIEDYDHCKGTVIIAMSYVNKNESVVFI